MTTLVKKVLNRSRSRIIKGFTKRIWGDKITSNFQNAYYMVEFQKANVRGVEMVRVFIR